MSKERKKYELRPIVMSVTVVLFALMLIAIVVDAKGFYNVLNNLVMHNAMWDFGWFLSLLCFFMVIFCVVCMLTHWFHPAGRSQCQTQVHLYAMVRDFPVHRHWRRRGVLGLG